MNIIYKKRNTGKTTELIKISAETGYYIVCARQELANYIQCDAIKLGYKIPLPITYDEFLQHKYNSHGIKGFLIDDAELLLERISKTVPIHTITLTNLND